MICALLENKEALANSPVAIDFVGFVDEEFAQIGSTPLCTLLPAAPSL